MSKIRILELNQLSRSDFVDLLGGIYEHSPWVAEAVVDLRYFHDVDSLAKAMRDAVSNSPQDQQMKLVRAHPDLAGRLAEQGRLTPESTREQESAGLASADATIIAKIQMFNTSYRDRFDFPFIICARLNKVDAILFAMEIRLKNEREKEVITALAEIDKIARLRLEDIVEN